ncbi:hypothetical protein PILCRDRAFT_814613 [Piloderma croceum F 1598]|uniref:Uncharacterized protein n=1 Tax=Piloderma croceum (strain F 1598) TaxID=765440 RepID=A0A0C3CDV5_PILCF|nr:hypothetical protein PILCRDRAFT_814613 [Piloderma croceum F 1598]
MAIHGTKSVGCAQLHYILDYTLLGKRRRLQTGTTQVQKLIKKIKKNWLSHDIELLGMLKWPLQLSEALDVIEV